MSNQIAIISQSLDNIKAELALSSEQYSKLSKFVAFSATNNPNLNNCTLESVVKAFYFFGKTGLVPDGVEATLVARKDKINGLVAVYQPMVQGVLKTIHANEAIQSFNVKSVYLGEDFKVTTDENGDHIYYEQDFSVERIDDNIALFFAVAKLKSGQVIVEVMTKRQVDKHKLLAKTPYIWQKWYSEMGIKTVIHRILKRLPCYSQELQQGLNNSLDLKVESESKTHQEEVFTDVMYPSEKFEDLFPMWEKFIKSGKKTAEEIIIMIESKGKLTDIQKQRILGA